MLTRAQRKALKASKSKDTGSGAHDPHPGPHDDSRKSEQCQWERDAVVSGQITVLPPPHLLTEYRADQKNNEANNKSLRLVNWLTFWAIVIYAGITFALWCSSVEANRINRDSVISVQRAFVVFDQTLKATAREDPKTHQIVRWEFRPGLTNTGATPTKGAIHHANWNSFPYAIGMPKDFSFADLTGPDSTPDVRFLIGPKTSVSGTLLNVPQYIVDGMQAKIVKPFFWGWVKYSDIFGEPHVSMFCTEITEVIIQPLSKGALATTVYAQSCANNHNCADDECDGEPYGNGQVWHAVKK